MHLFGAYCAAGVSDAGRGGRPVSGAAWSRASASLDKRAPAINMLDPIVPMCVLSPAPHLVRHCLERLGHDLIETQLGVAVLVNLSHHRTERISTLWQL